MKTFNHNDLRAAGADAPRPVRDVRTPGWTLAVIAAGTLLLAIRDPHGGGYGICPVLALTGYLCPTCGGLRAVHDLAHLDLAGAWAMNPLLTVALPILGILTIGWWWRAWRGYPRVAIPPAVILAGLAALMLFGIIRNF